MPKAKLFAKGGPDKKRGKLASKVYESNVKTRGAESSGLTMRQAQPSTADEYLEGRQPGV